MEREISTDLDMTEHQSSKQQFYWLHICIRHYLGQFMFETPQCQSIVDRGSLLYLETGGRATEMGTTDGKDTGHNHSISASKGKNTRDERILRASDGAKQM